MNLNSWAARPLDIDPVNVLNSVERGVTVGLIATFEPDLVCCEIGAQIGTLLESPRFRAFDYLPVTTAGRTLGLVPLSRLRRDLRPESRRGNDAIGREVPHLVGCWNFDVY
jgi:hypothetical protein